MKEEIKRKSITRKSKHHGQDRGTKGEGHEAYKKGGTKGEVADQLRISR